ncbi:MAG: valine--tRNA ligase [Nitrospirae bacterium]|nr:valine--tRNA ligase [Nitrospirota bacterium]
MSQELNKTYEPKDVENRWYAFWEEKGLFHADENSDKKPYAIVIPPPNITGSLHMGHALNNTLQDILIRYKRMAGYNVLWMPGTDHAGIATQNVVERQLANEGLTRYVIGRKKFVERVWKWKEESGGTIIKQLKRLGSSCDWNRERFTMDEGLSYAVKEVFVRLYDEGLIYRAERLINWCPRCLTALSDIEVEHEEVSGKLYYIRYHFVDDPKIFLTVATTRPETMLGDTAVAVHPEDERYNKFIGKEVLLPLTSRRIPIIADAIVDIEFGTGAVKITPAHDFNDFETGIRHDLKKINILSENAHINPYLQDVELEVMKQVGDLHVHKAREKVIHILKKKDFLIKAEDHKHTIGKCYRCKTVIEPYLSPQWYVKMETLAKEAIKAVEGDKTRFIPRGWENTYFEWMRNIKDWCISRQIWWGHQIPAWYCVDCNKIDFVRETESGLKPCHYDDEGTVPIYLNILKKNLTPIVTKTAPLKCPTCGSSKLIQDEDVLDTWFSSALWPFSTLGWPKKTTELSKFYPTDTLVTGFDIIFFWVARMIMMGLKFMNDVPFKDVYIHALVRDADGQKMSKSRGNVIDPLIMIDRFGADALRFTLSAMASPGRDIKLSEDRIEGYRNFCNKIWNASRFALMNVKGDIKKDIKGYNIFDRWILSRLNRLTKEITASLQEYRFDEAANAIYQFIWHEFCDWYLEAAKPVLYKKDNADKRNITQTVMIHSLETSLRLLHPFMPFITEEIWQRLPKLGAVSGMESIMLAPYPSADESLINDAIEEEVRLLQDVISCVRNIRGEMNIPPSVEIDILLKAAEGKRADLYRQHSEYIKFLAKAKGIKIGSDIMKPHIAATAVLKDAEIYIPLEGVVNFDGELPRLQKELEKIKKEIEFINKKLANQDFINKAPKDVVEKEKEKYRELTEKLNKIEDGIKKLEALRI